jgi:hypothetical protein
VPQAPLPLPRISAFTRVFDALCGERSDRASDPGVGPMHESTSRRRPLTRPRKSAGDLSPLGRGGARGPRVVF